MADEKNDKDDGKVTLVLSEAEREELRKCLAEGNEVAIKVTKSGSVVADGALISVNVVD